MRVLWALFSLACLLAFGISSAHGQGNKPKPGDIVLESKGYIVASRAVRVSSEVSGRVVKVFFEEGQQVRKDDVLAQLDVTGYELDVKRALAVVELARARYEEAAAGPGARKERVAVAKAKLAVAEAELLKAKHVLNQATIRAPISGTILTKNVDVGASVNPLAAQQPATLCEMADLADLEVEVAVQERDYSLVSKGQRCQVRPEAFPGRVYDGVIARLMPIADRAKGAVPVRVKVKLPKGDAGKLKPEMAALVTILANDAQ